MASDDGSRAGPGIDINRLFHALGDPTRRAILDRLVRGPVSVSQLAGPLGVSLTAVMQHLQILEECGLAATEKVGRVRSCRIASEGLDALELWVSAHRTELERQLDRLGALLEEDEG
ncbi:MAG TPA: metalloregulator ArsR/SmtB family transcription factor [Terracidiphilus sp.]|jgi:DNA-binding transcriptional ArsR family regulator|nr:metalloregulator ArsR/SmtB family transcription factor [Terracidiphilus sp.]